MRRTLLVVAPIVLLISILAAGQLRSSPGRAQSSVTYGTGWNLVAGPQGSHLHGAVGSLYTLLPGDSDYEAFPVTLALQDGIGYWAYFPNGGSIDFGPGVGIFSTRVLQPQWIMVGNPSDSTPATISGSVEQAQDMVLQPGHGTFVFADGLVVVSTQSSAGAATATPASTPLPPCVDGAYGPGAAGSSCRPTANTTPTALCRDGSLDYSRSPLACAGHGGVAAWLSQLPEQQAPTRATPARSGVCVPDIDPDAGNTNGPTLCADGHCSPSAGQGTCSRHGGIAARIGGSTQMHA